MARASLGSAALLTSFLPIRRLNPAAAAMPDDRHPHPSLEVVVGGGRDSFLPALKILNRPYEWNRHVETIFAAFFRSLPNVRFRRECLRIKDNGSVALDRVSGDDFRLPPDSPLLILLFYSASFIEDLREVVAHVATRYSNANLYAVGWSLGANILVQYLGQVSGEKEAIFHSQIRSDQIVEPDRSLLLFISGSYIKERKEEEEEEEEEELSLFYLILHHISLLVQKRLLEFILAAFHRSPDVVALLKETWQHTILLSFQSLGVVFGRLSIAPLFVFGTIGTENIESVDRIHELFSFVFWTLTIIPLLKYALIVLRADFTGEGMPKWVCFQMIKITNDIMRFEEQTPSNIEVESRAIRAIEKHKSCHCLILVVALFGSCMTVGDGILTPALSVLSASSGLGRSLADISYQYSSSERTKNTLEKDFEKFGGLGQGKRSCWIMCREEGS